MAKPRKEPLFFNRELSWLEFNRRVLEEAMDPTVPLLERVKFLSISSSNLDEFFMVRVGGLQQLLEEGKTRFDPAGLSTARQLSIIRRRTHQMVADQNGCLLHELEVLLAEAGIRRVLPENLNPQQREYLEQFFETQIYPVLAPMAIESAATFPLLRGLGLNLVVRLKPAQDSPRRPRYAVVAVPRQFARLIPVPATEAFQYVLIEDVIGAMIGKLFPGEPVAEWVTFRITRNADMSVREDQANDLLAQMREVLQARRHSACVRLEVADTATSVMLKFLKGALKVREESVYRVPGPVDLSAFAALPKMVGHEELKDQPWPPQPSPQVAPNDSMFDVIARKDVLLIHPYESFEPVVRLIDQAADDPDVLAIKQILYRTSENSPVVAALTRAAGRGKHVTAVVELKARFDEARNIEWAKALELAGVQVIYGLKWLKTHAKVCIIVRRESGGVRRYCHFGTGNYNEITATLYSDIGLMTCNEDLGADATMFFNSITGYSQPIAYRKLEAAPLGLRAKLLGLIESEIQRRKQGQKALIMAKINSLVDTQIIQALYKASQAGVTIQLNVRGICCLRPGVRGLSENITVASIVDRFLEHARVLYFHHGGESLVFISSADWMPRNLDRRVELLVPVEDRDHQQRLIAMLNLCFQDAPKARTLMPDGDYVHAPSSGPGKPASFQEAMYRLAREAAQRAQTDRYTVFEPQRPASSSS
ncbi:MAG: polyphosphate kinase 1 [Verrucomicrobiia bacterium]|jgi:polyphosphate kinase